MSQLLSNFHCVVFGFASRRSLAWGVASAWRAAGGCVSFGLQSGRFRPALDALTAGWPPGARPAVVLCDVASDASIAAACSELGAARGGRVDAALHSIAFAPAAAMRARALDVSRADWATALDVSAYSLVALARGLAPYMAAPEPAPVPVEGGAAAAQALVPPPLQRTASLTTLSFLGGERVVRGYRVMGVAKAALESSARYLAEDLVRAAARGGGGGGGAAATASGACAHAQSSPPLSPGPDGRARQYYFGGTHRYARSARHPWFLGARARARLARERARKLPPPALRRRLVFNVVSFPFPCRT